MVTEQLFLLYIFTYDLVMKSHLGFLEALQADNELNNRLIRISITHINTTRITITYIILFLNF